MSGPVVAAQPPRPGLHGVEWLCELVGTALLLLVGLSAVCLDFGPHSPLHAFGRSPRLLLTGLLFAGTGSLVAVSPLGRRSGAHLNPVVTLSFWTQRRVHPHDLLGYSVAQVAGAVAGTAALRALWGSEAVAVHLGATQPGSGLSAPSAALVEAGMTGLLVLTILLMTSSARAARWTPFVLWLLIAGLVWGGAPYTGTSLNPARSFGPAVLVPWWRAFWVYLAGPVAGGAAAVAVFTTLREREVLTAKLFHDPRYKSTLGSLLPVRSHVAVHGRGQDAGDEERSSADAGR